MTRGGRRSYSFRRQGGTTEEQVPRFARDHKYLLGTTIHEDTPQQLEYAHYDDDFHAGRRRGRVRVADSLETTYTRPSLQGRYFFA